MWNWSGVRCCRGLVLPRSILKSDVRPEIHTEEMKHRPVKSQGGFISVDNTKCKTRNDRFIFHKPNLIFLKHTLFTVPSRDATWFGFSAARCFLTFSSPQDIFRHQDISRVPIQAGIQRLGKHCYFKCFGMLTPICLPGSKTAEFLSRLDTDLRNRSACQMAPRAAPSSTWVSGNSCRVLPGTF